jgi:hypothetical protein
MKVLALDIGGTHVKVLATNQKVPQKFASGPKLTAKQMVATVLRAGVTMLFPSDTLDRSSTATSFTNPATLAPAG